MPIKIREVGTGLTKKKRIEVYGFPLTDEEKAITAKYPIIHPFENIRKLIKCELKNDTGQEAEPDSRLGYAREMDTALSLMDMAKEQGATGLIVSTAFSLGCIWTEANWKWNYESAALVGIKSKKNRPAGRKKAIETKKRTTKARAHAVQVAAFILYKNDPALLHNRAKTARQIEAQKHPQLRKRDGTYLGVDAIDGYIKKFHKRTEKGKLSKTFPK